MKKVALTGSLAAGKSTVAEMFRQLGVPVFSADTAVHGLYAPGGAAVKAVGRLFPRAVTAQGGLDRKMISRALAEEPEKLKRLEEIVHPLVEEARREFLSRAEKSGAAYCIMEIPLLFEAAMEGDFDHVIAVVADDATRRERALARPAMTEGKFAMLEGRQMAQEEKRALADFVIDNSGPPENTRRQVERIHRQLSA